MKKIKGNCLCEQIEFTVNDNFVYAGYCHCSNCRRYSGAIAIGGIQVDDLVITKGKMNIKKYSKSEQSISYFCRTCGSGLFVEKPDAGLIHMRYASLDETPTLMPQAHIYVASKADWYEINDNLPQYSEAPPTNNG